MANINLDPSKQSADMGVFSTRGWLVTNDQPFKRPIKDATDTDNAEQNTSMMLRIGNPGATGTIVWEYSDRSIGIYVNAQSGELIPAVALRVLSTATIDDVLHTTTCTNVTWLGGQ